MFDAIKKYFNKETDETLAESIFLTKTSSTFMKKYESEINQIYLVLQIDRETFDLTYIPFLENTADFIQDCPCFIDDNYKKKTGLFELCLQGSLNATKKRRGYMLPPGTGTENIEKEKSLWTFIIFSTSIITIIRESFLYCDIEVSSNNKTFKAWNFNDENLHSFKSYRVRLKKNVSNFEKHIFSEFFYDKFLTSDVLGWIKSNKDAYREW